MKIPRETVQLEAELNTMAVFPQSAGLLCTTSQGEVGRVPVSGLGVNELED